MHFVASELPLLRSRQAPRLAPFLTVRSGDGFGVVQKNAHQRILTSRTHSKKDSDLDNKGFSKT